MFLAIRVRIKDKKKKTRKNRRIRGRRENLRRKEEQLEGRNGWVCYRLKTYFICPLSLRRAGYGSDAWQKVKRFQQKVYFLCWYRHQKKGHVLFRPNRCKKNNWGLLSFTPSSKPHLELECTHEKFTIIRLPSSSE